MFTGVTPIVTAWYCGLGVVLRAFVDYADNMKTTRLDGKPVAAKTKLLEGEHSIDRAQPSISGDLKVLRWSVRPVGHAKPLKKRTQVPKRMSDGKLRERARSQAEEILRNQGRKTTWSPNSEIADYITAVVKPLIEESSQLSDRSKARYLLSLKQLIGGCDDANHKHQKSLKLVDIRNGSRYRTVVDCLQEIAKFHGSESARQARTVLGGYVLQQLQHDELIENNVLRGARIDLKTGAVKRTGGTIGGVALGLHDYRAAVDYLLELDPAQAAVKPIRGRWTMDDVIARRRNTIDLTLLQAATGLRISEALQAWCGLVGGSGTTLHIDVVADIAKGDIPRVAHFLEPRIAEHLSSRVDRAADPSHLIVSAPASPSKQWELRNATKAVEALYLEMHAALGIAAFKTERAHVWRATLNTMLVGVVPEVMRAAQFGHTGEVNRKSYTDSALTPAAVAASVEMLST